MFVIHVSARVNIHLRVCECVCTLALSLAQRSLYRIRNAFAHHGRCGNDAGLSHALAQLTMVLSVITLSLNVFSSQGRPVVRSFLLSFDFINSAAYSLFCLKAAVSSSICTGFYYVPVLDTLSLMFYCIRDPNRFLQTYLYY